MTAEILIMNKSAISMAADSVVTVGDKKTYAGVNKLFMLSNNPPMGIMIYGTADFMEMPMESLIKEYRKECENKGYTTVSEFSENFMEFLKKYSFSKSNPEEIFQQQLNDFKKNIPQELVEQMTNELDNFYNVANSKFDDKLLKFLNSEEYKEYDDFFDDMIEDKFNAKPNQKIKEILHKIFIANLVMGTTGIVIAGFNKKDIYPSYSANNILTIVKDEIWHVESKVENTKDPIIQAFAQTDVVSTFIMGFDLEIANHIRVFFEKTINDYPNRILDTIEENSKITGKCLPKFKKEIHLVSENNNEILEEFDILINNLKNTSTNPLLNSVDALPKEELSNMAESLIHITSLKRKVEEGLETVGGDIDVAIISKGDGFIWTKRKHYFDPNLNYQFFNRKK